MADSTSPAIKPFETARVETPTMLQLFGIESGPVALGILLAYHGRWMAREDLRILCGVSREGAGIHDLLMAAENEGLEASLEDCEIEELRKVEGPFLIQWGDDEFVIVEGFSAKGVYINSPDDGRDRVGWEKFQKRYGGKVLSARPGPKFEKRGSAPSLKRDIKERLAASRGAFWYVVLGGSLLVIPNAMIPAFSKVFVDEVLVRNILTWLHPLLSFMVGTMLVVAALSWLQLTMLRRLQVKLQLTLTSRFFWHLLRLPFPYFGQHSPGELNSRFETNDVVAEYLSRDLTSLYINAVQVVVYAALMLFYDVTLTLITVGLIFSNVFVVGMVTKRRVSFNRQMQREAGNLSGFSLNGIETLETLKATNQETEFFADWSGYLAKQINVNQRLGLYGQALNIFPKIVRWMIYAVVLSLGGLAVMDGRMTVGDLVAFQTLLGFFSEPFSELLRVLSTSQESYGNIGRINDVMRYEEDKDLEEAEELDRTEDPHGRVRLKGELEIRNLTFGYSKVRPPLIENFSLKIRAGRRVALVGLSGSGKSTIAALVAGLYTPWSGQILFDGKPRKEWPRSMFCRSFRMVDQDIFLFEGTARENISLWDDSIPDNDLIQAAKDACIHDIIAARPGGYECQVDENGQNFSGGQRQRVEIARALATNPSVIVFDEATSALDPITEESIDENLRRRGCTCLLVAHRLSTIRDCDEIIVLEGGKVVERGTHDEMKDRDGLYSKMIRTQ